jgi:hypothetical protein
MTTGLCLGFTLLFLFLFLAEVNAGYYDRLFPDGEGTPLLRCPTELTHCKPVILELNATAGLN